LKRMKRSESRVMGIVVLLADHPIMKRSSA
jgi:hypothetical protein